MDDRGLSLWLDGLPGKKNDLQIEPIESTCDRSFSIFLAFQKGDFCHTFIGLLSSLLFRCIQVNAFSALPTTRIFSSYWNLGPLNGLQNPARVSWKAQNSPILLYSFKCAATQAWYRIRSRPVCDLLVDELLLGFEIGPHMAQ